MAAQKSAASGKAVLLPGDAVEWASSQGKVSGQVTRKITGKSRAGGHIAKASTARPQYEVQSAASGKKAIHKPEALKKKR